MTHFQKTVYAELKKIPAGKVITYQDLAKRIGNPKAARAIGHAMAINPYLIEIPCHRVVSATGKIGNYSGGEGTKTKNALLVSEGVLFLENGKINPKCFVK